MPASIPVGKISCRRSIPLGGNRHLCYGSAPSVPAGFPLVVSMCALLPSRTQSVRLVNGAFLMALVLTTALLPGCSAMRRQLAQRREACDTLCQRARAAKSEGCPDQADLLLNEAVRQRPDDLETRRQLAEAMWDCGRQHEAVSEYRELAQAHPHDARLHRRLAVMLWTVGQKDSAAQSAEQALRLDPNSTEALLVKARAQAVRRDYDEAVGTYIRLSRVAPDRIDAKMELAEIHVVRGNSQQACALLREVLAQPNLTPPQRSDVEWKLGLAYASSDRWADASAHMDNAIGRRDASNADWQLLMTAKMMAGQDPSSVQAKAIQAASQPESDTSAWAALRDRLLVRSTMIVRAGGPASTDVIRADYSRNATRIQ